MEVIELCYNIKDGSASKQSIARGSSAIQSAEQRTMMVGRRVVRSEPCLPVTERDLRKRKLHIFILNVILPLIIGLAFKIIIIGLKCSSDRNNILQLVLKKQDEAAGRWCLGWFES